MARIVSMSEGDSYRLVSGQVITSVVDAVKELVDNSLDAGATCIEIRLQENGLEAIEVTDDGHGIPEKDLNKVCEKYATSKISSFEDLVNVSSFGFRGEALSSLASLSTSVRVLTKVADVQVGFQLEFDREGKMVKKLAHPRTRGTTVRINQLFSAIPVRQRQCQERIKLQLAKLVTVIKGYSLANIHLKISLVNHLSKEKKELLRVLPSKDLKSRASATVASDSIFGEISKSEMLQEVAEELIVEPSDENLAYEEAIDFQGFISSPKHGKSNSELQFFSVNSRPVDYPKLSKIINQVFRSCDPTGSGHQYPVVILNMTIPSNFVDVNVTPDKRTVFISNEKVLFALIKSSLLRLFGANTYSYEQTKYCQSSSQMTVISSDDHVGNTQDPQPRPVKRPLGLDSSNSKQITDFYEPTERPARMEELMQRVTTPAQSALPTSIAVPISVLPMNRIESGFTPASSLFSKNSFESSFADLPTKKSSNPFLSRSSMINSSPEPVRPRRSYSPDFVSKRSYEDCDEPRQSRRRSSSPPLRPFKTPRLDMSDLNSTFRPKVASSPKMTPMPSIMMPPPPPKTPALVSGFGDSPTINYKAVIDNEPGPIPVRTKVKCSFDFSSILNSGVLDHSPTKNESQAKFTANSEVEDDEKAIEVMNREMDKSDFERMRIVGQFNNGFIITELGDTLFVIDQHASDERRNFDELLETAELDCQPLIKPQFMTVSAYDEYLIKENLNLFSKNGFKLSYHKDRDQGNRFSLDAVPMSTDRVFGMSEVDEMLNFIKESPSASQTMRPTSVKEMLAMKACRKSIMIGTPLSREEMKKVVQRMAHTSYPWTCAHGRPTIRCLGKTTQFRKLFG